jgi:putative transposase
MQEIASQHQIEILDSEVDIDHVHAVVSLPLTMTPLVAIQYLKGGTSKGLFALYPELKRTYKKGHLWSPGKFVGSIGHITLEKAKQYLEAHHAKALIRNPCSEAKLRSRPKGEPLGLGGCQFSNFPLLSR